MKKTRLRKRLTYVCIWILYTSYVSTTSLFAQIVNVDDRSNYAKMANSYFKNGELEVGKQLVDEGLSKYPRDSDLHMLLGRYYYEKGDYDLARFELMESLKLNRNNVSTKQILVNVETATMRYSSAICYINELLEVNPYWKGLWRKKIDIYRLQGNHTNANRLLERISQIYPDDQNIRDAYLHYMEAEARSKRNAGNLNEAIRLSNTLLEKDAGNEAFYVELINNYLQAGDYENALITTERGLYNLPHNLLLTDKKTDILGALNRYDELLFFLQSEMQQGNKEYLHRKYNYFLSEAARNSRMNDPYTLYTKLFERNPGNSEAFNYVYNAAMGNGLYDDALEAVKKVKQSKGETKDLLLREREIYKRIGMQSKADQLTVQLYKSYPDDADITYDFVSYRLNLAKSLIEEGGHKKAVNHLLFVAERGDEEQVRGALVSLFNCMSQLGRYDYAVGFLDQLINRYPEEPEWYAKKALIYGKEKKYTEAMEIYAMVFQLSDTVDVTQAEMGFDEQAVIYVKELAENYQLTEAMELIRFWLNINPESNDAIRHAINVSAQMGNCDDMGRYAQYGIKTFPRDVFFRVKLAEAYNGKKMYDRSLKMIEPLLAKNPYHKGLIAAYSQSCSEYSEQLIKEIKPEESLAVLDKALLYDPQNQGLKYRKGIAYEKMHFYDSAHYYQSFYEPSLLEVNSVSKYLGYLKSRTYKNQVGLYYLRSRYAEIDVIHSITTMEYARFGKNDTYVGRVNYAGRQDGKGLQGQLEWNHNWRTDIYTRLDAALANKYFPVFAVNGSFYKLFKYEWEMELGAGYRVIKHESNLFNVVGGLAKTWEPWWLNVRFNGIISGGKFYTNFLANARFNLHTPRTYLTAMASVGSAPDINAIDNQLYSGLSMKNSMAGIGIHYMISEKFSAGVLSTLYNYKDELYTFEEEDGKYRNLYNLYFQLHVRF